MSESVLLVGTIGQSVWRSEDEGETWKRGQGTLFLESDIRALLPLDAGRVLLGADTGVYESPDAGKTWTRLPAFPTGYQVWSLHASQGPAPDPSRRLWAGTCPAALFYSDDEGATWHEAAARWLRTCAGGSIQVRITTLISHGPMIWAGAEIDGVRFSSDAGETWTDRSTGLTSLDIHDLQRMNGEATAGSGGDASILIASTNAGLFRSDEDGLDWKPVQLDPRFEWRYCRGMALAEDGRTLLVGNGSGPPGSAGALWSTLDAGGAWQPEELPEAPNSTIWDVVVTPTETWAYSVLGQLYRRHAPGAPWQKLRHEFGEIRALARLPG